jgi:putrescine transport system ATP-binding protein
VVVGRERPDQDENFVRGVVGDIAYMGSLSVFEVRLPSGKEIRVTQPNFNRHMGERFTWNDKVFLSWDVDSSVVLTS